MQHQGYQEGERGAIVRRVEELSQCFRHSGRIGTKLRFLAWLAGPAGLLSDRTDGTCQFSHLSFQEYLAAWHFGFHS